MLNLEPISNPLWFYHIKGLFKQIPATFNQAEFDDRLNAITT